jgi:putative SOS response-associated peptidase YedK
MSMCGRFGLTASGAELAEFLELKPENLPQLCPRYNIAPSQSTVVAFRSTAQRLEVKLMQWGLVPSWAADANIGHRLINARSETASVKPSFRAAFQRRRCIVLADGFYEWTAAGKAKQPHAIALKSRGIFAMAGLFEQWSDPQSTARLLTFTILTTIANDTVLPIHHRMPVILDGAQRRQWLSSETPHQNLHTLLVPCAANALDTWPVSPLVNSPRHDEPRCREAIERDEVAGSQQLALFTDSGED